MSTFRLDHVQLAAPAGCEEPARAFYGELLGLEEVPKPDTLRGRGGVWFALNAAQQLHVGVDPALVHRMRERSTTGSHASIGTSLVHAGVELPRLPLPRIARQHEPWPRRRGIAVHRVEHVAEAQRGHRRNV